MSRNFHEALIETQIVSNGILPSLLIVSIVRKVLHDVLIDSVKGESFLGTLTNGHHDEGVIGIRRFFVLALLSLVLGRAVTLGLLGTRFVAGVFGFVPTARFESRAMCGLGRVTGGFGVRAGRGHIVPTTEVTEVTSSW